MSGTVADVIRTAEGELGKTDGTKYFRYFGYGDLGPWCVAGARWDYAVNDVDCHWSRFVAPDKHDAPSKYLVGDREGRRGDFLSLDWDLDSYGDHAAVILGKEDWGYNTIEFNTGNPGRVAYQQRLFANVACIIRPDFAKAGDYGELDVDGWIGPLTIDLWQRQMGTPHDGRISGQERGMDKWRSHVTAVDYQVDDGLNGSSLIWAVMLRLAQAGYEVGPRDGKWGWWLSAALQRQLRDWGYYTGGIDHDFGTHSAKALQRSLNDGRWK